MAGFERMKAARFFAAELKSTAIAISKKGVDQYESQLYLTQTGAKASRVMLVGTATEIEDIGTDNSFFRMRASDPTGVFFVTAGQYQPESVRIMQELADKLPVFVAVIGKMSVYTSQEGAVLVSVRAERIAAVDEGTRDTWILETAKATLDRLALLKTTPVLESEVATAYPHRENYKEIVRAALMSMKGAPAPPPVNKTENKAPALSLAPAQAPAKEMQSEALPSGKLVAMSEEDMRSFVEQEIIKRSKNNKKGGGVKIESLANLCKSAGMTLIQLETAISGLMNEGKVYEPKNGLLMPVEV